VTLFHFSTNFPTPAPNGGGAEGFDLMAHLNAKVRKLCKESPWRPC
jgi:hypothetical protein